MIVKRKQFSRAKREQILAKCNRHCAYCGCILPYENMQVDHTESYEHNKNKERRGETVEDINRDENLLPSCGSCNRYKRELGLEGFREWMSGIVARIRHNDVTFRIAERYGMVQEVEWDKKFYFEKMSKGE